WKSLYLHQFFDIQVFYRKPIEDRVFKSVYVKFSEPRVSITIVALSIIRLPPSQPSGLLGSNQPETVSPSGSRHLQARIRDALRVFLRWGKPTAVAHQTFLVRSYELFLWFPQRLIG